MALLSDYTAGTVTVAAGGTAVTGVGTAWLTAGFQEGDEFFAAGWHGIVQSVNSNTSLTLYPTGIRGAALAGAAYRLRYQGDGSRLTAQARQLIELLGGSGNFQALAALDGSADKIPRFTGAGTMTLDTVTAFMRTLLDDADGATAYGTLGEIPNNQLPARLRTVVSQTTDADTLLQSGFYGCGGGANGIPVAVFGIILHLQYDSAQTAIQFYWRGNASDQRWMRRKVSGVWSAWVCNSERLLGAVSQSAGVPTGGTFERGSNSNGEYVRIADGTLICTTLVTIKAEGDATTGIKSASWTYPAAFSGVPSAHMSVITNNPTLRGKSTVSNNASLANLYYQEDSTTSAAVTARAMAIGRWF